MIQSVFDDFIKCVGTGVLVEDIGGYGIALLGELVEKLGYLRNVESHCAELFHVAEDLLGGSVQDQSTVADDYNSDRKSVV